MHEWGITQKLIEEIKRQADQNNIKTVTKVEIGLGKDSDLTQQELKTCFETLIINDDVLKDSKLEIKMIADCDIIITRIEGESI